MSTKKALGGSFGALIVLIISQVIALLVGNLLVIAGLSKGLCNIIAGAIYIYAAYIILKFYAIKMLKINITEIGIPKFHINIKWIIVAILLPTIVMVIFLMFPGTYVSSYMSVNDIFSTLGAGIMFTGIAAGFVEEMIFRGVMLNLLKNRWNTKIAILVPSVLFGIVHIIGMNFSTLSCLLVLIAGTMVGIMFSLIALENNSIWNSGIVHALWNIVIIGGALKISEKPDEYSVITYVLDTKNVAFTGGEFGIESSIIAVVGFFVVILFTLFIMRKKRKIHQ